MSIDEEQSDFARLAEAIMESGKTRPPRPVGLGFNLWLMCTLHPDQILGSTGTNYDGNQIVVNVEPCKKCLERKTEGG